MLQRLIINNIAIIKDIDVSFADGMNVISGDTGAGKSLVIDSLLLLSGNRAIQSLIRYNEKKAFVTAYFTNPSLELKEYLSDLNITIADQVCLTRELSTNRNLCRINEKVVTLQQLKDTASMLFSVHEQQDTFKLFSEDNYFSFIDNDSKIIEAKNNYLFAYNDYKEILDKCIALESDNKANADKLDFLLYEQKELADLNLTPDEDKILAEQIEILKNYDQIYEALNSSYNLLETNSAIDNVYEAMDAMTKIASLAPNYEKIATSLSDIYYNLSDIKSEIYHEITNFSYDKGELDNLQARSYEIEKIKDKYKKSVNEIIAYYENINYEIEKITNYDDLLANLKKEVNKKAQILFEYGQKLHNLRVKKALIVEEKVVKNAKELELNKIDFKIQFAPIVQNTFYENGLDKINFLVTFNVGEPLKELTKVASGGELSRLMLGFKAIEAENKQYSLMVFDEIDTGVSGEAAVKIANKIKEIATKTQVICITHIASVAALAQHEFLIHKEEKEGQTFAFIKELNIEERVRVIARMISGNNITPGAILNARELLGLS